MLNHHVSAAAQNAQAKFFEREFHISLLQRFLLSSPSSDYDSFTISASLSKLLTRHCPVFDSANILNIKLNMYSLNAAPQSDKAPRIK